VFRQIAEWGIQAAHAIEHAHSVGIVHRDIKPANLLIDSHGALWVTDFGLARTATDAGLTMTGDVLGTLRYMSPEQALAKHGLVDHRTDVYSLGVTLYEVLTGTPAAEGKDREQILNAITLDEPRPPRQLNPAIPQDLETIVLKAMAREPRERYGTAKELADDLRRFLDGRPLVAKRSTLWQRAAKWMRRRRAVVRAISAGLAVAVVTLTSSTLLVWRAYRAEIEQRQLADARLRDAREQRRQARQAVDTMYLEVAEKWLQRQPQMGELQRQFLEKVLRYYQESTEEGGEDEETRFDKATASLRVGQLLMFCLAKENEAQAPLRKADALLEELAQQFPDKATYTLKLAEAQELLALSGVEDRPQKLERAVALLEDLVARYPADPDYRFKLAGRMTNLGMDLIMAGKLKEGESRSRQAITLAEDLVRSPQPKPEYYRVLACAAGNLADSQQEVGNWIDALGNYHRAVAAYEQVTPGPSSVPEYEHGLRPFDWHNLGNMYRSLGTALGHLECLGDAEAAFFKAIRVHAKLVADFPKTGHYWRALSRDYWAKGTTFWACGQSRQAALAYGEALEFGDRMAAALPPHDLIEGFAELLVTCPDPNYRKPQRAREYARKALERIPRFGNAWTTLGIAAYRLGDHESAIAALQKAVSLKGDKSLPDQFFLAMAYWRLGDERQARRWFEGATGWMNKNGWQGEDLLRFRAEASALLGIGDVSTPDAAKTGGTTSRR
jgi:tetratricopeptide (TPR) repeat protein